MIEEIRKLRESDVDLETHEDKMVIRSDGSYELSTEQILKIVDDFGHGDYYAVDYLLDKVWIIEKSDWEDKEDYPYILVVNFEEWDRLGKAYAEEVLSLGSGREFVELK